MGGQQVGYGVGCKWAMGELQVGHGKAVIGPWLGCKRAMGGL